MNEDGPTNHKGPKGDLGLPGDPGETTSIIHNSEADEIREIIQTKKIMDESDLELLIDEIHAVVRKNHPKTETINSTSLLAD